MMTVLTDFQTCSLGMDTLTENTYHLIVWLGQILDQDFTSVRFVVVGFFFCVCVCVCKCVVFLTDTLIPLPWALKGLNSHFHAAQLTMLNAFSV